MAAMVKGAGLEKTASADAGGTNPVINRIAAPDIATTSGGRTSRMNRVNMPPTMARTASASACSNRNDISTGRVRSRRRPSDQEREAMKSSMHGRTPSRQAWPEKIP